MRRVVCASTNKFVKNAFAREENCVFINNSAKKEMAQVKIQCLKNRRENVCLKKEDRKLVETLLM